MKVNACFAAFETLHFEITHLALTRSARLRAGFSVRQHEGRLLRCIKKEDVDLQVYELA